MNAEPRTTSLDRSGDSVGSRRPQTHAKRAREQAVRERRERKQAKKHARVIAKRDVGEDSELGTPGSHGGAT
jgi:hypothetical protein